MLKLTLLTSAIILGFAVDGHANEIRVNVTGIDQPGGQIGCALHTARTDFPMGQDALRFEWTRPTGDRAVCVFSGVAPGTYAIAIANDLNGNRRTDTNAIGLPTEEWGVSRNARPTLRAPRFAEAAFDVGDAPVSVTVEVD